MLIMRRISKSTLRSTKIFALKKGLRMKMFGIWMKQDFAQAVAGHIGS